MEQAANTEIWQVEANGEIYNADFAEIAQWIHEGALLRIDRVRKGNLRWIEAGKVPALTEFFNAKDASAPPPPVITTSTTEVLGVSEQPPAQAAPVQQFTNTVAPPPTQAGARASDVCAMHPDVPAVFHCETCGNSFCKGCPNSYGGTVKICPFCGAMCKSVAELRQTQTRQASHSRAIGEGFGFGDFGKALAYPFKFKASLFFGAVMFMFFSIGQQATAVGGIFMLAAALTSFMLANMLTFGVMANTVENFTQGNLDANFMPTFDDFSLWDDVVHPFFLSIGAYVSSFAPLFAVVIVGVFVLAGVVSVQDKINSPIEEQKQAAARSIDPGVPYSINTARQSQAVKDLVDQTKQSQQQRVNSLNSGNAVPVTDDTEEMVARANEMIQQQRKAQLEGALGKTPETVEKDRQALVQRILGYGAGFLLLVGITLIWGFCYFPAACAVAGYTRSFAATINPFVVIDTIKHLGSSYVLVLIMGLLLAILSGAVSVILNIIFIPLALPGFGNLPAQAIGSLFTFYFSVVFSCVLGYALYKASDRLQLAR